MPVEGALGATSPSPLAGALGSRGTLAALIRSHWRLTSDAVRASASPNTCGWRRTILDGDRRPDVGHVEHAGLGRELRVEDDLEQQVAELARELRGRARVERVVDLVRLLEQVVAQRGVGLLPVPRAAVGLAQPGREPGHAPRRGEVGDGRHGREIERVREVRRRQRRRRSSPSGMPKRPTG